jgi:HAD superfamily hydrolase (TIGR01484 family)
MSIKLIVTDLDNTLLRRDKTISDYTRDVFAHYRERRVRVAFATARSTTSMYDFTERVPIDGLCASNGSNIFADGELLIRHVFDIATQRALIAELKEMPSIYRLSAKTGEARYYCGYTDRTDEILFGFLDDCMERFNTMAIRSPKRELAIEIIKKYPDVRYNAPTGEDMVDIVPSAATKRNAIVTLCEHWGITPSEVVVFGDDYNDIDMMSLPGVVSVAVANAIDEVKAVASHICGDCDEDGVARWLEENVQ